MAVPHVESDIGPLREDVARRRNELARSKMKADPVFAKKIMELLAQ